MEKLAFRWLACWLANKADAGGEGPEVLLWSQGSRDYGVQLENWSLNYCSTICKRSCEVSGGVWGRVGLVAYRVQSSALNLAFMSDKSLQCNKNIIS